MASVPPAPTVEATNILGAVIFLSYVVAALVFTGIIVYQLIKKYASLPEQDAEKINSKLRIFSCLSALSFSVLSYNMLHFLITRYQAWTASELGKGLSFHNASNQLVFLRKETLFGLWDWLRHSHLFEDFATTICLTKARYLWTVLALLMTMRWNLYMNIEGYRLKIPSLWKFAVLSQILPVSFAMNLFFLAVTLHGSTSTSTPAGSGGGQERIDGQSGAMPLEGPEFISFLILLLVLDSFKGKSAFMFLVAVVRLMIFAPFFFLSNSRRLPSAAGGVGGDGGDGARRAIEGPWLNFAAPVVIIVVYRVYEAVREEGSHVLMTINDDPAVAALGYDFFVGLLSLRIWKSLA